MLVVIIAIIVVALAFDYINGFHDAANSIATVVATKVLKPLWAVAWAAAFNFIAAFVFKPEVAKTIQGKIIDPHFVTEYVVLAALVGAIVWNLITWVAGLPTSSSHALIGGLVGAALTKTWLAGKLWSVAPLKLGGLFTTIKYIVLAPAIGLVLALIIMSGVNWICRRKPPGRVDRWFRVMQLVSAAAYSLGHGLNDAQKTMGIIWMLLISGGYLSATAPLPRWVILLCHAAIAAGTMSGGWRIVHTMGMKITKLKPPGGFSAETAAAITLIGVSKFGIPVSTTHTITGAIVGVGATRRLSAVRWGVAGRIVWAWVLTLPAAAIIGGLSYLVLHPFVH